MKKNTLLILLVILVLILTYLTMNNRAGRDVLYQTSTFNALLSGIYDGEMTIAILKKHGDFGIGTFDALDGELIALDGVFYQVKSDGKVYIVKPNEKTPFASVTFFDKDQTLVISKNMSMDSIKKEIDKKIGSKNLFYAIKISGKFADIKTRAPVKQNKPYPQLVKALAKQPVFEFKNVEGTIVAYRLPDYVTGLNVPGYHFHFLTKDKKSGGHVLAFNLAQGKVIIDETKEILISLPGQQAFQKVDLAKDRKQEMEKVEK